MDDEDYRLKYGVPVGVPLVCVELSEHLSRRNAEQDLKRYLTARGPAPGFQQRESVRQQRKSNYARLAETGTSAAAMQDKTARRREMLKPYPVTVDQAAERLNCSKSAAYTFLSYCVGLGRLRRVGRGTYDEVAEI